MARKRPYQAYKMVDDNGRTDKYGITSDPDRRERENRKAGHGKYLKPMSGKRTREGAKSRETELINQYERRTGRKPPGNKIR